MLQIKIIRHSERLDFTNPIYWLFCLGHYWADSPLTTNGYKIANDKGKKLISDGFDPKYIFTSPYNRTLATATEIKKTFCHSEIIIEPLLSEYQPNFKHKISLYPDGIPTTYDGEETNFTYPEKYDDFCKRVQFILKKITEKKTDSIVITHGEVLKVLINHIQTIYPELLLDVGNVPYLTTLSFTFDTENNKIVAESIKLE